MGRRLGDERRDHAHRDPDEEATQCHGEEGDDTEGYVNG